MDATTEPSTIAVPATVAPFAAVGATAVVAGGVAAAVTGPTGWERGSWVAAFLVLVAGVGQLGLGAGQAELTAGMVARRRVRGELALFNGSAALVLAGTLVSTPALVTVGGFALVAALGLFATTPRSRHRRRMWVGRTYTGLLLLLLVSTPVGLTLSWLRA